MLGAVAAVTTVIGPMLERRSGTILFTTRGAAINPNPARTGVGISFAGEGVYARMLHDDLRDRGIHVGHTASAPASRQTETTNPTTSPTSSGATTPSASEATFQLRLGINYSQRTRRRRPRTTIGPRLAPASVARQLRRPHYRVPRNAAAPVPRHSLGSVEAVAQIARANSWPVSRRVICLYGSTEAVRTPSRRSPFGWAAVSRLCATASSISETFAFVGCDSGCGRSRTSACAASSRRPRGRSITRGVSFLKRSGARPSMRWRRRADRLSGTWAASESSVRYEAASRNRFDNRVPFCSRDHGAA